MKIFLKSFIWLYLTVSMTLVSRYDHVCAYSNESVSKFRKKTFGSSSFEKAKKYCKNLNLTKPDALHFDWPVDLCEFWVSSLFGPRKQKGVVRHHGGVDMAATTGTEVKSAAPGKIIRVESDVAGYGTVIEVLHKYGMVTRYGHLNETFVCLHDKVDRGQVIATVGSTGHVHGKNDPSHLHFEIINASGKKINPLPYLYCAEVAFAKK